MTQLEKILKKREEERLKKEEKERIKAEKKAERERLKKIEHKKKLRKKQNFFNDYLKEFSYTMYI